MVSGTVRAPALDLLNEQLLTSHLQAVWLAASGVALAPDIPQILDLSKPDAPLREEILAAIHRTGFAESTRPAMRRILDQIINAKADQSFDVEAYIDRVSSEAAAEFHKAFDRWRDLYSGARRQYQGRDRTATGRRASRKSESCNAPETGRRPGRRPQGRLVDFYSYRYLATEGFLPGYNFPRPSPLCLGPRVLEVADPSSRAQDSLACPNSARAA